MVRIFQNVLNFSCLSRSPNSFFFSNYRFNFFSTMSSLEFSHWWRTLRFREKYFQALGLNADSLQSLKWAFNTESSRDSNTLSEYVWAQFLPSSLQTKSFDFFNTSSSLKNYSFHFLLWIPNSSVESKNLVSYKLKVSKVLFVLGYLDIPIRPSQELLILILASIFELTRICFYVSPKQNNLSLCLLHCNPDGSKVQEGPFDFFSSILQVKIL